MFEPEELMARIVDLEAQLKVSEMAPPAAEQLIACLEGEIAKRDARIADLEHALEVESMRLAACGTAALGYFDGCAGEYKSGSLDDVLKLLAELAAIKAQGVVMPERKPWRTLGHAVQFHAQGWNECLDEVARLNAAPVQQVSVPDGNVCVPIEVLRLYEFMASSFTPFTSQHEQIAISLRKAKAAMLAAALRGWCDGCRPESLAR